MNFSFPDLPDEQRTDNEQTKKSKETNSHKGSYEALLKKMGRADAGVDAADGDKTTDNEGATATDSRQLSKAFSKPAEALAGIESKMAATLSSLPKPFDSDDDGFEVDSREADEAVAAIHPGLPGPLSKLATLLSWIMVPLIMPVVTVILALSLSSLSAIPFNAKLRIVLVVAGFNTILPMVLIGVLKGVGIIKDLGLNCRKERVIPYLIIIAGLVLTTIYLRNGNAPAWLWSLYVGAAVASAICCVINMWWKISAHATGAAGVIATLIIISMFGNPIMSLRWWLAGACLLTGLMGSARVFLRRHTDRQVMAGYVCGFCCIYFTALIII